jgi:SAM-dependent methyltransferase
MKNPHVWFPTKYSYKNNKLRGSRNPKFLGVSSRLMTDITGEFYQYFLPKYATGKLADLGCGNAPFYLVYKDLVSENICVDWPNTGHKNQYLDVECDLNQPLPFSTDEFDTIVISEVLEHIANPELIWKEMARILKPGGKILLSVPFLYKIHEAPYDYFRYTRFALENFANKNNLQVLELKTFGGVPEVLTDIISKNLIKLPLLGSALANLIQQLCWFFIHTRVGKKVSANSGIAYPLGYFMVVEKKI